MSKNESEHKRLERFRRGEPGAFDALYAEYGPRIYRFCLRLSGSAADAEDLTQEMFVAAFRSLHQFEQRSTLSTYLYRIAVYQWRQMRGIRKEAWGLENDPCSQQAAAATDPSRIGEARMALSAALATLPEAQRAAFVLVKAEGFTCREASEALSIPVGTVKYHVFQAIARLRVCLAVGEEISASTAAAAALPQREAFDAV